jgi:hypothetical protein
MVLVVHTAAADRPAVEGGAAMGAGPELDVELVAGGLVAPVNLTFAPDGSDRRSSSTRPGWC